MNLRPALHTLVFATGFAATSAALALSSGAQVGLSVSTGKRVATGGDVQPLSNSASVQFHGGSAAGTSNLVTGEVSATAVGTGGRTRRTGAPFTSARANFYDVLTLNAGASGIGQINFDWQASLGDYTRGEGDSAAIYVSIAYEDEGSFSRFSVLANHDCPVQLNCTIGQSIAEGGSVPFQIRPGATYFELGIRLETSYGGTADVSMPATFSISLPDGVTYTSVSGHFLEGAAPTLALVAAAVPEGEAWALMSAGLGLLGLTVRRSRRRAA